MEVYDFLIPAASQAVSFGDSFYPTFGLFLFDWSFLGCFSRMFLQKPKIYSIWNWDLNNKNAHTIYRTLLFGQVYFSKKHLKIILNDSSYLVLPGISGISSGTPLVSQHSGRNCYLLAEPPLVSQQSDKIVILFRIPPCFATQIKEGGLTREAEDSSISKQWILRFWGP